MRNATAMMALSLLASGALDARRTPERPVPEDPPEPPDEPSVQRWEFAQVDRNGVIVDEEGLKQTLAAYVAREPTRTERRALARQSGQPTRWGRARG